MGFWAPSATRSHLCQTFFSRSMLNLRRSGTRLCLGLLALVAVLFSVKFVVTGMRSHNDAEVISRAHYIQKHLELYVSTKGTFPSSLASVAQEFNLGPDALKPVHGERIEYVPPSSNSPTSFPVLRVVWPNNELIVTKAFERHMAR
jgi:hypothetical protein